MKRLPTIEEWKELQDNCTWEWSTRKKGMMVRGHNGKSIFLPAEGYRSGRNLYDVRSYGDYWSSSLDIDYPYDACSAYFDSDNVFRGLNSYRLGFSVRLVSEQPQKGFVDLGLPSGLLWAKDNEDGLFTYDEAMKLFNPKNYKPEVDEVRVVQCNIGLTMGQLLRALRDIECKFDSAHIPLRINGKSVNKIDISICTDSKGDKYIDMSL